MQLERAWVFVDNPIDYPTSEYTEIHRQNIIDKINQYFEDIMVDKRGNSKKTGEKPEGVVWRGFSNVPMNKQQHEEFVLWYGNIVNLHDLMDIFAEAGYKINLSYHKKNRAFSVAVTCTDPDSENAGLTMTSMAPTSELANARAYYKHFIICGEEWPIHEKGEDGSQWG